MAHVEESLQLPRNFEGAKIRSNSTSNTYNLIQVLEKTAMMRNGQMELE